MLSVWRGVFVCSVLAASGCAMKPVDSFTLEVDLPANFRFKSDAAYRPATGEICTLPKRRGKQPEDKVFDTLGKPVANRVSFEVPLTEVVDGCPLVLRSITFDMYAKWGERSADVGGDFAFVNVLDRLEEGIAVGILLISKLSKCRMDAYATSIQRVQNRELIHETGCTEATVF